MVKMINFPSAHRELLEIYESIKSLELCEARELVSERLLSLSKHFDFYVDKEIFISFARYLDFFSKKLKRPLIKNELYMDVAKRHQAVLDIDPSRYDKLFDLAFCYIQMNRYEESRCILKKIASSHFPEREKAQQLLESFVNGALK